MEERSQQDMKEDQEAKKVYRLQTYNWNRFQWEQRQKVSIVVDELLSNMGRVLVASSD